MSTDAAEEILATLNCFAYGYAVEVHVNGTRMDISGGKSESTALLDFGNAMKAEAAPQMQHIFVLKQGDNTISVKFARQGDADAGSHLDFKLSLQDPYAAEILKLDSSAKASGQVQRTFRIGKTAPKDAATIRITDADL